MGVCSGAGVPRIAYRSATLSSVNAYARITGPIFGDFIRYACTLYFIISSCHSSIGQMAERSKAHDSRVILSSVQHCDSLHVSKDARVRIPLCSYLFVFFVVTILPPQFVFTCAKKKTYIYILVFYYGRLTFL
jgi:hypothetical protein